MKQRDISIGFLNMYGGLKISANGQCASGPGDLILNTFADELRRQNKVNKVKGLQKGIHLNRISIRFIDVRSSPRSRKYDILFGVVSQHGHPRDMQNYNATVRVYWSAENLARFGASNADITRARCDYFVGFIGARTSGVRQNVKHIRFPNWLYYWDFLADNSKALQHIAANVAPSSRAFNLPRACFVARNENNGKRKALVQCVRAAGLPVDCAGRVCKSVSSVEITTGILNNPRAAKQAFLKRYTFNLCPENSDSPGYVTEKIMQACMAGCVPIYWGDSALEQGIINPNRVIFCTMATQLGAKNENLIMRLIAKHGGSEALNKYCSQPIFLVGAVSHIIKMRDEFRGMVAEILQRIGLKK